jgi:putative ABC transport system permease protein
MRMLLAKRPRAPPRSASIGRWARAGTRSSGASWQEGVIVSMLGSVVGLCARMPTVAMFDRLVPDSPVALALTPTIVVTVLLVCLLAGLVSGIYPAWRIAAVPPTRYLGKI